MNQIPKPFRTTLGLMLAVAAACRADHPDKNHRPTGRPETSLSGVYINTRAGHSIRDEAGIYVEPIANVLRVLGKPTKVVRNNKCESTYQWVSGAVRIEVGTGCVFQKVAGRDLLRTHGAYSVEVWGTAPVGKIGVTGKGLALGNPWSKVKRLYGTRCECGTYSSGTGSQKTHGFTYAQYAQYQWGDKVELDIDADAQGRVVHILLVGELE